MGLQPEMRAASVGSGTGVDRPFSLHRQGVLNFGQLGGLRAVLVPHIARRTTCGQRNKRQHQKNKPGAFDHEEPLPEAAASSLISSRPTFCPSALDRKSVV